MGDSGQPLFGMQSTGSCIKSATALLQRNESKFSGELVFKAVSVQHTAALNIYKRLGVGSGSFMILCLFLTVFALQVKHAHAEPVLTTTITNPTPASGTGFGYSVDLVGNDRVIVGKPSDDAGDIFDSGAAYLFNTNGTLITTFTNPSPAYYENFGQTVAAVGSGRVLIGAPGAKVGTTSYAGEVYLFSTNGSMVTNIPSPFPALYDYFGSAIAVLGDNRMLISAPYKNVSGGLDETGAAYLFDPNGALLTTLTNPTPGPFDQDHFGGAVAIVGSDILAIGVPNEEADGPIENAGVVHLFNTNGILLTTITNPVPATSDLFGFSVAGVGNGLLLVGAYKDDEGAQDAGVAYLFQLDGTLLNTITNPTPESLGQFGHSVAAAGNDRMLIGAPYDNEGGIILYGSVYLYGTDGILQETIANPTPANRDWFGRDVSGNSSMALIGAYQDDTAGTDAGAVYLYDIGSVQVLAPWLAIVLTNANQVSLSWEPDAPGFVLQQADRLSTNTVWYDVSSGSTNPAVIPVTEPAAYFRLYTP